MPASVTQSDTRGLGLVAATFTAFHANGALNLSAIEQQAEELVRQRLRGVFVCGTSGEFASLTVPERIEIARRWRDVAGPDLEIIVHVGHTSLGDAQALAAHAEQIGAAGIAAVGPYYFRPRAVPEVVDFSARIAAAAPNTPFSYYHIPSFTGVALPMAEFLPAAATTIPTFAGLKFTHENLAEYAHCVAYENGRYEIFFGRDEMLLGALAMGASSGVGTTYNYSAPIFQRVYEAFKRGDMDEARHWQGLAIAMIEIAVAHGGMPAFKAMMRWFRVDCGPCRPPLVSLDDDQAARLHAELSEIGFLDAVSSSTEPASATVAD
ncbi:MAG: dihydrodipicolinate synthetase [Thermomicrobiales bacterium]|nr:dihydrodipicolinate synthetase [Thermomicrobiales bacterium]